MASAMPQASGSSEPMIAITLTTKSTTHPSIPASKYFVPASWKRFQLSELLNKVLGYEENPVPFDFVLFEGKELLRTSLSQVLASRGLSEETSLELEYIESVLPPSFESSIPYDDWISDVDITTQPGNYLTASYDGSFSILNTTTSQTTKFSPHAQSVLSACFLPSTSSSSASLVATASTDSSIKITSVPTDGTDDIKVMYQLSQHGAPVTSIRASPTSQLLSASQDGTVAYWTLDKEQQQSNALADRSNEPGEKARKRRKRAAADENGVTTLKPVHVLEGHKGKVSKAIFDRQNRQKAFSAGNDHSVKEWNLEYGVELSNRTSDKVLTSLDQMVSTNLLVTGAMDRTVCFWDTRQETQAISLTLTGHSNAVSAVKAHPTSPLLALSASYDGTLRIWDARAPSQALFTLNRQPSSRQGEDEAFRKLRGPDKVLCVDWDGSLIASGGEDKTLQLHKATV